MAHANAEFALAARAYREPPLAHQLPAPASLATLRARMLALPADDPRRVLWSRTVRQDRQAPGLAPATSPGGGGMHAGDPKGLRFVEPVRRGHGSTKRWAQR